MNLPAEEPIELARTLVTRRGFVVGIAGLASMTALTACSTKPNTTSSAPTAPAPSPATSPAPSAPAPPTSLNPAPTSSTVSLGAAPADASSTTVTITAPPETQGEAPVGAPATFVDHGLPTASTVALTFHLSGKPSTVTAMLDLLQSRSVAVTAFAVGSWITANPEITKRLVADGHELGNHTEHHLSMDTLTPQQISDEIVQCGQALVPFIGSIGRWFRPSATVVPNQVILVEAGLAGYAVSVGYDVDSVDNQDPGASAIIANVKKSIHPGAIVSLHFGHQGTIRALPDILDHLATLGLRPVTIGALLG